MRNRLLHAYFDINKDVVWVTETGNLPGLEAAWGRVLHEGPKED